MTPCDYKCSQPATVYCTYGHGDYLLSVKACHAHAKEVWDACAARVNAGIGFWINEAIERDGGTVI